MVDFLQREHGLNVSRACTTVKLSRSTYYRPVIDWRERCAEVIDALNATVERRPRWGLWTCLDRLRFKGHAWSHKKVHRVYCEMGLNLKRRTKRRLPNRERVPLEVDGKPHAFWSLDFMQDTLYSGRCFWMLNVLDEGVRECLAIEVDTSFPAERVVRVRHRLKEWRGLPKQLRLDNGSEFIAHRLNQPGRHVVVDDGLQRRKAPHRHQSNPTDCLSHANRRTTNAENSPLKQSA